MAATLGSWPVAIDAPVVRRDPCDLPHAVFNGRALGLCETWGEGRCRQCPNEHSLGLCKTCSIGLDTGKPFCLPTRDTCLAV